jgi:D-alanyl-D-alanine carboxypeptidase
MFLTKEKFRILFTASLLVFLTGWHTRSMAQMEATSSLDDKVNAYVIPTITVDTIGGLVLREDEIRAGLLYDAESGVVVWQKDMHYAYPIASLTKMMVALLTVEAIKAGKADWSDEVRVERVYRKSRRSRAVYRTTETYSLESLVQLAMIPSNNQACVDIAKYLDISYNAFIQRMNTRAMELGMTKTFYSNPSGLPAPLRDADNSSSPHDLLLLSLELLKHEEILKITSVGYAEVSNDKRTGIYRNHNHLVIDYENDVDGLKTGFTKRAKFCLVATSRKEGHRMISIVLGVNSPYTRNEIVAHMLNGYYNHIGCGAMLPAGSGPLASKTLVSDPAAGNTGTDENITYKTVWTKERKTHTVRNGETLSSIAQRYSSSYQQVKKWNRLRSNKIFKGQKLLVYVSVPKKVAVKNVNILDNEEDDENENSVETDSLTGQIATSDTTIKTSTGKDETASTVKTKTAPAKKSPKKSPPSDTTPNVTKALKKYVYHVVQPGDTLWSIAQRYNGITVDDIKRVNKIQSPRSLKPGTRLKIKVQAGS